MISSLFGLPVKIRLMCLVLTSLFPPFVSVGIVMKNQFMASPFFRLFLHLIQDLFLLLVVIALGDEAFFIHTLELFESRFRALG
jgi:hypothetical protein